MIQSEVEEDYDFDHDEIVKRFWQQWSKEAIDYPRSIYAFDN